MYPLVATGTLLGVSTETWKAASEAVAVVGGLIAAFKAVNEMRLSRLQRARDLAWAQAKEATAIFDHMFADPQASNALRMLDYSSREYQLPDGKRETVTIDEVERALRTSDAPGARELLLTPTEGYIRDCFDSFLGYLDRAETSIEVDLVREADMLACLEYYLVRMAARRKTFESFMKTYGYERPLNIAMRTAAWRTGKGVTRGEKGSEVEG